MNNSNFQLALVAGLALGLGFTLSSSDAVGYPGGPVISTGTNPVWSVGGTSSPGGEIVLSAPTDSDMVVTDAWVTFEYSDCGSAVTFTNGTGDVQAKYYARNAAYRGGWGASDMGDTVKHTFSSGIRVKAGDVLYLSSSCTPHYTLSGYYAHP